MKVDEVDAEVDVVVGDAGTTVALGDRHGKAAMGDMDDTNPIAATDTTHTKPILVANAPAMTKATVRTTARPAPSSSRATVMAIVGEITSHYGI